MLLKQVSIGFGGPPLLDDVTCRIEPGQRIGLLGRNGSGKSTLLRLLQGSIQPDHGEVQIADNIRTAYLAQDVPLDFAGSVFEIVKGGLPSAVQAQVDTGEKKYVVDQILTRMQLDPEGEVSSYSSGMKRRVLLATAIVNDPELLLLDEPTNHLDIDAIEWLQAFLMRWNKTLVFVTHDREFLRAVATRILEIDRGQLYDWSCDYETFLARKAASLAADEKHAALFDKKLAEEEVWIRRGIKARRTRNEGRVKALEEMRRERSERVAKLGRVQMQIDAGTRSGNLVAHLEEVCFGYADKSLIDGFTTTVMRGDKVGIVGPNGVGKSTLLKIMLGELVPQRGTVKLGTNLQIAYFDQLREQLNDQLTPLEALADGYDTVQVAGQPRHIIGYLRDFLFTPERARTRVERLSGGERNRLLLARLFAKPANLIVLDEPTNDLDTETLELLEERLVEFTGTLLIVSHDRAFLNNVVTSTIAFEHGNVREYVGGYDDWLRQRAASPTRESPPLSTVPAASLE